MQNDIVFDHTRHKEMWNYLYEHTGVEELYWPGWENIPRVFNNSFMCDYAHRRASIHTGHVNMCTYCPFGMGEYNCTGTVYWEYHTLATKLGKLVSEYRDEDREYSIVHPEEWYVDEIGKITGVLPTMAKFIRDLPIRNDIRIVTK